MVSTMSDTFYEKFCCHLTKFKLVDAFNRGLDLSGYSGTKIAVTDYVAAQVVLPGLDEALEVLVCIDDDDHHTADVPVLLGTNIMDEWKEALKRKHKTASNIPAVNRVIDTWRVSEETIGSAKMATKEEEILP